MAREMEAEPRGCPYGQGGLAGVTLADPEILARPNEFYRAIRREDPVHFDEALGMYLVSRYEDIVAVLRDQATFSVELGYTQQFAKGFFDEFKEIMERDGGGFFPDVIMSDAPYHTRVRSLLEKVFTTHRVATLEPAITALAAELIEKLADKAEGDRVVDVVGDFAVPMTGAIMCEQLGFSQVDAEKVLSWALAVVAQIGRMQDREQMIENARKVCELQNYIIARVKERDREPRQDIISDLVHAQTADGDRLAFEEVVSLIRAMVVAGNETTTSALSHLFLTLATRPDIAAELAQSAGDDRLLTRFVEELLRIEAPSRGMARTTTREVELGGRLLPKHAHLLVLFGSGCDDDDEFASSRTFDPNRKNLGKHVAFGAGPHRCIGAPLARMEIRVTAREVIRRLTDIKLATPIDDIQYVPNLATHTLQALPVVLRRKDGLGNV